MKRMEEPGHWPLPFKPRVLEIQDQSNLKASNAEVIQHLPAFVIRDALNCFGVHDQAVLDDEIGNVLADNLALYSMRWRFLWSAFRSGDTDVTRRLRGHAAVPAPGKHSARELARKRLARLQPAAGKMRRSSPAARRGCL